MPDVKTNALMPKGETNGLSMIATELVAEARHEQPRKLRAVIALVDARRATVDADTGDWLATVRFRRVELLLPGDLPEAEKLIRRALESRMGQTVLPLDLEKDVNAAFAGLNLDEPDPDEDAATDAELAEMTGDGDDAGDDDDGQGDDDGGDGDGKGRKQ